MDFDVLWDPDSMIRKKFTDYRIQIIDSFGFWYPEVMIHMHLMDSWIWISRLFPKSRIRFMDCHARHGVWDPDSWILMDFMDADSRIMHYDGFHIFRNSDS